MSHKLQNYLRTYRRRTGLSQDEVAFLLGCGSGTKVSRYEHFARQPNLQTILAYETVFRAPARDLFAGAYQKVERQTARRARLLVQKLVTTKPSRMEAQKLAALKSIAAPAVRKRDNINE